MVTAPAPGNGEELERKLAGIHKLLIANFVVSLVVILVLLFQSQQVASTRQAILDLKKQAQTAVGQFTPTLDSRLGIFETRMNEVDAKIKQAEDGFVDRLQKEMPGIENHFVSRMEKELPAIMDKYLNRKMEEMKGKAPKSLP
jgi:hypothetical protein